MAGTGPFSFAQQQSLAKGVSAAASVTNLPILNQLDVLMKTLTDSAQRDDLKLKALQEISNHFEALAPTAAYPPLMDSLIRAFLKLFNETVPQFIGENNTQQLRKLMLEMTNRMPCNDYLKQYGKAIQQQMFKIIQTENEENVMIALKIVTEHQKQFRPQFSIEVQQFLHFCKGLYRDLPQLLPNIFEPRRNIRVNEIQELHIEQALSQAFCVTPIQTEQKHPDGSPVVYTLLPRGVQSLKVLAELPIVIVLLYQIHRTNVQNDIADFIPLILNMVNLCPSREQRNHPNFNRELFIEFLSAQVKALSFLAFLTRMFHEMVQVHSGSLVQGIMQLLEHCPPEVTHQRRELLMATRHLLGSELRVKFVPHLPKLFNENLMIGSGWTANETLRPLVFSMLADLVHHVRQQLNYLALSSSVHLFSRCIHDPTLPAYVQAMCCKLMLNLVECIVNTTERHPDQSIRELLFYMLEVFIRKFKVVAVQHLPAIMEKHAATNGDEATGKINVAGNEPIEKDGESDASPAEVEKRDEEVADEQKTTAVDSEDSVVGGPDDSSGAIARSASQVTAVYWGVVAVPMSVHDCRSLVKVLVGGAKTTIWGIGNARVTGDSAKISPEKETELFFRLLRYGIQCLDIYTIMQTPGMPQGTYQRSHPTTSVRSKEEKEALDHFASVFTMLNPMTFKEIFATNIEFLIDRISGNYALQLICNSFLVNPLTSAKFGSILVEYLLEKLPEMGVSNDRAVLYLKLFKLVFTSVSCSQSTGCVENEQMLKPHLHRMVHRSMELALKGKEPINYFLLLRALFRSIGGGSHDLLYQEFLPLLPSLLQQLNRLQSGSHKQQMRELFVELCLTVPVRLSSLLPYLPLLMDPLVCALNGSQTLVQQGLRTLELCVDNLQPEYLYEHMAPVRAALMHGLWHTVGSTGDEAASLIAFRILGKFGGSNRKMLSDPQTLAHRTDAEMGGPALAVVYHDMAQTAATVPAADPPPAGSVLAKINVADAVKSAVEHLRSDTADAPARKESWLYVKAVLLAAIKPSDRRFLEDDRLSKHLLARLEAIDTSSAMPKASAVFRCSDEASRSMFLDALTAVFFAVVAKDLRSEVLSFFNSIVRQLTLQAIFEQTGGEFSRDPIEQRTHMDGGVLVDAIANALADSSKDFCHSAIVALRFMKDTATAAFGSVEKASKLPLFRYMLDSLCGLCFRHAWYARLGGCTGLQYFLENFPKSLAQENAVTILCAYMEVMVGLSDEVSSGALDMAVHGVELLLKTCFKDSDCSVAEKRRLVASILVQVVRHMDSPDQFLRQQCVSVVEQLAALTGETVISILSLVKKELNDFLDRGQRDFSTMSMASQIGFMDAFAYLHTLDPLLFTFDLDDDSQKCFADALIKLCKTDESVLEKIPTYKSSTGTSTTNNADLISLKCTAIRAAVACYIAAIQPVTVEMETNAGDDGEDEIRTITDRQQLFLTALKALTHGHAKLQDEAFAALRMAMKRVPMERNVLHAEMRPVLLNLSEYKTLSLNVVKRLLYLTRLSPNTFNEKFCDQILVHLKKWVESALVQQGTAKTTDEIKACEIVLEILHETPAASARFIDVVIPMITKAESQLNLEPGINWRIPLLRYLIRYPLETIQFLVQESNMRIEACRGLFLWLIKQVEGGPLRQILTDDASFINNLLNGQTTTNNQDVASEVPLSVLEVLALRLVSALSKRDPDWITKNQHLINRIRSLWNDDKFKARYKSSDQRDNLSMGTAEKTPTVATLRHIPREQGAGSATLEDQSYYHGLMPREEVVEMLTKNGQFIVRKTEVDGNSKLVLSVKGPDKVVHLIIRKTPTKLLYVYRLSFDAVSDLVAYHQRKKKPVCEAGVLITHGVKRRDWQLANESVNFDNPKKPLGKGEFGDVWKGVLHVGVLFPYKKNVAVKTLNDKASNTIKGDRISFLREANLMRRLKHKNIVRLFGVAAQDNPIMIVMELAPGGSLLNRLHQRTVSTADCVRYTTDAATGMAYLSQQRVIHRDLAARNCLIGKKDEVKISDFGLSLIDTTEQRDRQMKHVPIRWLAPETLSKGAYSAKTDVWSFGVLMFEVFSGGARPYDHLSTNSEVREKETSDHMKFEAPKLAVKCMLRYFRTNPNDIDLLFDICQCFVGRLSTDFSFVRSFLENEVVATYSVEWRRLAFKRAVDLYVGDYAKSGGPTLIVKILQYVILPCLAFSLEHGDGDKLIGSLPAPDEQNNENLVSLFVSRVIDNQKSKGQLPDGLHIMLYQLSCLFVEFAPQHIHDSSSKKQGSRLRTFMLFAWPCLQQNSQQDPTTKYTGHLLIAHIIDKFAINRKIVLQVFHSLLKAHQQDPRGVIRQALNILTPAVPLRMEDGYLQLMTFAKKIIIEEGHTPAQLFHLLQVIVRHYKVYYHVRHQLTQYLMNGIQKLVTSQGTVENRKLAVDVCEMVIKWELYRLKTNQQSDQPTSVTDPEIAQLLKSPSTSSEQQNGDKKSSTWQQQLPENNNPIEKLYVDQVVNILVRMAAQVPEAVGGSGGGQAASVEALNKRSLQLLKVALKADIWGDVATVKLPWMEKALATADPQTYRDQTQQNFVQSYICLDVLAYLVSILPPVHVVPTIKQCQRGIISCLSCPNSSVVRSLYALITRLLAVTKSSPGGLDDLEMLNQYIAKFVNDSLINYEKMLGSNVASLFGTMTLLKAMCTAHPSYLDRVCLMPFVKTLQKLVREHTTPMQSETVKSAADIISLCLELMRPRLDALPAETRKLVTQSIFLPLIDKSPSARVVSMIIKIVDEWIKNMDKPISALSLLGKLMVNLEKRFGNEKELHKAFLGTVLHVYETPALRTGDVVAKLEPAFHAGLCHNDPEMRAKFFAVFNRTISRNPYERLWHVFCMQNWEPMQRHFWVKQCVNLMLAAVDDSGAVVLEEGATFARGFEAASGLSTLADFSSLLIEPTVKQEAMDVDQETNTSDASMLRSLLDKQRRFMLEAVDAKMDSVLRPLIELCYADDALTHRVWLCLFPSVWSGLSEKQRDLLMNEVMPFLASGGHMAQKDAEISVIETFVEAFARCSPPVIIKPNLVKYIGCAHHMWHRAIILLENQAYSIPKFQGVDQAFSQDRPIFQHSERLETLDSLAELYKSLCEVDMWQATWNRRSYFEETSKALAYSQQGFCSQAIKVLENAMDNMQKRLSAPSADTLNTITLPLAAEMNLWEEEWIRCTKELNQWDVLKDFANNNAVQDPGLLMECAWRLPNWTLMKEALTQVESCCRPEFYWKTHLYRGMLLVCQPDDRSPITVERCVELANQQLISDWRKLPAVVSHSHLPILQAAHLIQELSEAGQVAHSMALAGSAPQPTIINEVKSIVKTWRNRAPTLADPLSHWYDVYNWRLHHYLTMLSVFESWESAQQQALLPIHSCAQCMIQLAKVSRQHGHIPVALECLHKLHTMPNLPTMDGHAKLYQHIKCLLKVADVGTRQGQRQEALYEGLDIIENTNISYFTKDQSARIFALKGALLSKMEKSDEANKAFSAALQMMDSLNLAWALWGDHLEGLFFNDRSERAALNIGLNAVVAFLEAARQENESKSRKHLAKLFWMLKALPLCGDTVEQKMNEVLLKYGLLLPAFNWLPWLPQLVSQLRYRPSHAVAKIIAHVAQAYPQQTFYVLRNVLPDNLYSFEADSNDSSIDEDDVGDETALSWQDHMVRIVGGMRKQRPTDMKYLDAILREIENLRETWAETALRSCRALLHDCYRLAFEHRHEIQSVLVTKELAADINAFIDALSMSDARDTDAQLRATTAAQIRSDLDLSQASNRRVLAITHKLTKWIAVLEAKVATMPRYDSISEHSECLSLFSNQMANVEVFSEALTPKPGQYAIPISRFMPRFEIIRTASTVARRLSVRGQSGKIYSFVVTKTNVDGTDSLVLQLFRMINRFLTKERETSRRLLQYAIPKSLTIGARCLLLEGDESATVLYDVMAATCRQRDMTPIDLINRYYDRMVAASGRASQKLLGDILKDISCPAVLPVSSLKQWMAARFPNATDYFTFRKQISLHLALLSVAEFVLHLSWLNIDEMSVNLATGQLFSNSFVFDINDKNNELDANRPVPFRLSACLQDFLGWSIDGNLTGAMIATARCLQQRNLPYLLRPILWDVYRSHATAASTEPKELISRVNRAVAAISTRLQNVANFEGAKSQVHTLVLAARQNDNLCRMDPAWHPWF